MALSNWTISSFFWKNVSVLWPNILLRCYSQSIHNRHVPLLVRSYMYYLRMTYEAPSEGKEILTPSRVNSISPHHSLVLFCFAGFGSWDQESCVNTVSLFWIQAYEERIYVRDPRTTWRGLQQSGNLLIKCRITRTSLSRQDGWSIAERLLCFMCHCQHSCPSNFGLGWINFQCGSK